MMVNWSAGRAPSNGQIAASELAVLLVATAFRHEDPWM
jgi:hypothetical protein